MTNSIEISGLTKDQSYMRMAKRRCANIFAILYAGQIDFDYHHNDGGQQIIESYIRVMLQPRTYEQFVAEEEAGQKAAWDKLQLEKDYSKAHGVYMRVWHPAICKLRLDGAKAAAMDIEGYVNGDDDDRDEDDGFVYDSNLEELRDRKFMTLTRSLPELAHQRKCLTDILGSLGESGPGYIRSAITAALLVVDNPYGWEGRDVVETTERPDVLRRINRLCSDKWKGWEFERFWSIVVSATAWVRVLLDEQPPSSVIATYLGISIEDQHRLKYRDGGETCPFGGDRDYARWEPDFQFLRNYSYAGLWDT